MDWCPVGHTMVPPPFGCVAAAALEEVVLEAAAAAEAKAAAGGGEWPRAAAEAFVSFGDAARFWAAV